MLKASLRMYLLVCVFIDKLIKFEVSLCPI